MTRTRWIHELRWPEIADYLKHESIVLIPIGATEQHGRHLPLLVDTGWAIAASEYAAAKTDVLIAPPVHIGWSPHHMGYAGTITFAADTLRRVTVDIGLSLIHHGFTKLIIVNGNRIANFSPLEIAAVEITNRTGAFVGIADVGMIAKNEVAALTRDKVRGFDHAGEIETAFALHWAGGHVAMSEARAGTQHEQAGASRFDYMMELDPAKNGNAITYAVAPEDYRKSSGPDGVSADPRSATAEQGRDLVTAIGANLALFIEETRQRSVTVHTRCLPV